MGDRWSNPLDQWPDPEVYIHYPSRQQLAYMDVRNLNRTFPGRPNGPLTERTCYAICELIRKEKIDLVIDLHEAELQYPVISVIVAHPKGLDLAAMAQMIISSDDGFSIGVEASPEALPRPVPSRDRRQHRRSVPAPRSARAFPRRHPRPDGPRTAVDGQR
jgi:Succinylglutamate desuccinylase / Aspartoacylase family.